MNKQVTLNHDIVLHIAVHLDNTIYQLSDVTGMYSSFVDVAVICHLSTNYMYDYKPIFTRGKHIYHLQILNDFKKGKKKKELKIKVPSGTVVVTLKLVRNNLFSIKQTLS